MVESWYPGHMAKARRLVKESLAIVDVVIEVRDARLPKSSANPDLRRLTGNKPMILVLNKEDLAESAITHAWLDYFHQQGIVAIACDAVKGRGINELLQLIRDAGAPMLERLKGKGRMPRSLRIMIVGIPNVGKSQLINALTGRNIVRTGDRAGVTRGQQWIKVGKDVDLLDTPGILWPNEKDPEVLMRLEAISALDGRAGDPELVALSIISVLHARNDTRIHAYFGIADDSIWGVELLEGIGRLRGLLVSGGRVDLNKTGVHLMRVFQTGKLNRISMESPQIENNDDGESLDVGGGLHD